MDHDVSARLRRLPTTTVLGRSAFVASTLRSRLLGLARLDRAAAAPLLIPRCASVHSFGMRFPIDVYFLDPDGRPIAFRPALPPRRLANCRGATAVLEIPAGKGGEIRSPCP